MKYSITFTGNDWILKIWEPALPSSTRTLPFFYKIQQRFQTEEEALDTLSHYQQYYEGQLRDLAIA